MKNRKIGVIVFSKKILDMGSNLRIPYKGKCMYPTIKKGNITIITPIKKTKLLIGDIIVYPTMVPNWGRKMVAHRIIKKYKKNDKIIFIVKGDRNSFFDPPLQEDNIMGKVIAIEKPNVTINLDCKLWRIANYMIGRQSLLSLLIYRRICFLKRAIIGNRKNRLISLGSQAIFFSLFPMLLINFIFVMQAIKSKFKPNIA